MRPEKILLAGLIALMVFQGCQTIDFPDPPIQGDPQFSFEGLIGGEPVTWLAGNNDYYMETSYAQDDHGVYNFIGHLRNEDCQAASCPNSLRVRIKDVKSAANAGEVDINQALNPRAIHYSVDHVDSLSLQLNAEYNRRFEISCLVNGEPIKKTTDNATFILPNQEDNRIKLSGKLQDGTFDFELEQSLFVEQNARKRIKFNIKSARERYGIQLSLSPETAQVTWNTGHTGHSIELNTLPKDRVIAEILYKDGDTARLSMAFGDKFITASNADTQLEFGFSYNAKIIRYENPKQTNSIEVEYFDGQQNRYSSLLAKQTIDSRFTITKLEDFGINEYGEQTKKIHFEVSCFLSDGQGNVISLENGSGVFGVAYPE